MPETSGNVFLLSKKERRKTFLHVAVFCLVRVPKAMSSGLKRKDSKIPHNAVQSWVPRRLNEVWEWAAIRNAKSVSPKSPDTLVSLVIRVLSVLCVLAGEDWLHKAAKAITKDICVTGWRAN